MVHIHVMGASGSGTTSLGRALAERLDIAHLDTDDFFWMPTDPPFTTPRDADQRIRLLLEETGRPGGWVLSGSALKWGVPLEPLYDLIVFLRIAPELRMARIRAREVARYGDRIGPGGDMPSSRMMSSGDIRNCPCACEFRQRLPHWSCLPSADCGGSPDRRRAGTGWFPFPGPASSEW